MTRRVRNRQVVCKIIGMNPQHGSAVLRHSHRDIPVKGLAKKGIRALESRVNGLQEAPGPKHPLISREKAMKFTSGGTNLANLSLFKYSA